VNEHTRQRLCRDRRRAARAGASWHVRRELLCVLDVHLVRPGQQAQSAVQDTDDGPVLRTARQPLLQRDSHHRPARDQWQVQGWLQQRLHSGVREAVSCTKPSRPHSDERIREAHLHGQGAHRREGIAAGRHSRGTALLGHIRVDRDQAVSLSSTWTYSRTHTYQKPPLAPGPDALFHRLSARLAGFKFWQRESEGFAPGSRLGEVDALWLSTIYRRGCLASAFAAASPAFQNPDVPQSVSRQAPCEPLASTMQARQIHARMTPFLSNGVRRFAGKTLRP